MFLALLVLVIAELSAQTQTMAPGGPAPSPFRPAASAQTAALLARLIPLADSASAEDQAKLTQFLETPGILDELDEPKVRDRARSSDLQVGAVLDHLRTNRAPVAGDTLAALTRCQAFNSSWQRQELLARALAGRGDLSPAALAYLDSQSQPDSVNLHIVIQLLADNGSPEAIALLGRKLADPAQDMVYKLGWLRGPVLQHRRDRELLEAAAKWIAPTGLERELRVALAQVLFEYRLHDWYPGREDVPRPPAESQTQPEAMKILRRIGDEVLNSDFPSDTKAAVKRTLK